MVYNNDNNHWGDSMAITGQRLVLANKIKELDFEMFKGRFEEGTIDSWKTDEQFHKDIVWKDVIKYSFHDNITKNLKLGNKIKNSPNVIYDFIISGYSFGEYIDDIGSEWYNSDHGIMILKVDGFDVYCYYKTTPGGCPSCGLKFDENDKGYTELYMTYDIDNIVLGCMNEREINYTLDTCKWN